MRDYVNYIPNGSWFVKFQGLSGEQIQGLSKPEMAILLYVISPYRMSEDGQLWRRYKAEPLKPKHIADGLKMDIHYVNTTLRSLTSKGYICKLDGYWYLVDGYVQFGRTEAVRKAQAAMARVHAPKMKW